MVDMVGNTMHIQALVFDLDGTAMPVQLNGTPSSRVIEAVKKAKSLSRVYRDGKTP